MQKENLHIYTFTDTVVCSKDVGEIINKHPSSGWRKLKEIKKHMKKPLNGYVTASELSEFTGLSMEYIVSVLKKLGSVK